MAQTAHTVLLVQASGLDTRQYSDYDSLNDALQGICHMYEQHLKKMFPLDTEIQYDLSQLFEYIDALTDLSLLVFKRATHSYAPQTKEWIKEKLYMLLRTDTNKSDG
ncbi:unnamed protein product [Oppiella nova]|uniref:Enhancer of rudimentary homolog n=1 Tax=Oppiella nova TaxID=334625 RepID=A0A7R9LEZ4_9ACAR|nr:unnamed protein product [Oppiella nova]CAG2162993.1 unnamed protein product [Oppiella nova]